MRHSNSNITSLLEKASGGSDAALEDLYLAVEDELRTIARRYMTGERTDHTLQPTALVDDAFMALTRAEKPITWENRRHFYRLAARAMRRILIDHAKSRNAQKRGSGDQSFRLPVADEIPEKESTIDIILLNDALKKLALESRRLAEVVELHWFAGYTFGEIAGFVRRSVSTVKNDWATAKAWLHREMKK